MNRVKIIYKRSSNFLIPVRKVYERERDKTREYFGQMEKSLAWKLGLCLSHMSLDQGGIFIVPHLLWHDICCATGSWLLWSNPKARLNTFKESVQASIHSPPPRWGRSQSYTCTVLVSITRVEDFQGKFAWWRRGKAFASHAWDRGSIFVRDRPTSL